MYRTTPSLDNQRVTDLVAAAGIPMALHGGTGMRPEQFSDLIARGCAKLTLEVREDNARARGLYQERGFRDFELAGASYRTLFLAKPLSATT